MKTTSKLIGSVLALIIVILAIFLVTKFNSHESARVATVKSSVRTSQTTSSSSRKTNKKNNKSSQTSSSVASNEENDNQVSAVAPKASSQEQNQTEGSIHRGQVADSTAGTDKAKTEKGTDNSQSSLNFGALDNGDISSIVGTWTLSLIHIQELSIVKTVLDGIRVVGSLVGTRKDLEEAFDFGAQGLVVPVVETVPVDTAVEVFDQMEKGEIQGRKVLDFTK